MLLLKDFEEICKKDYMQDIHTFKWLLKHIHYFFLFCRSSLHFLLTESKIRLNKKDLCFPQSMYLPTSNFLLDCKRISSNNRETDKIIIFHSMKV